ncbi:MAG: translation elongation factor Ts [Acidimicrobiales bacterium]|nr:translation elongation factor Ts [Acidimicrobiales bacterium]
MAISAKDVQELRKSTGAGMMDAKKALTEADGDFDAAVQILREKGLAKAATRVDRDNTEGLVVIVENDDAAAMVHVKSETDFSAKSEDFVALANDIAAAVLADGEGVVAAFTERLDDLKLNIKENIELGAVVRYAKSDGAEIDAYLHGGGRAGVLVEAEGVDPETLHEIALHIAFAKPRYLSRDEVSAAEVEKERSALLEITKSEGKPEAAWDKIVEGRVNSWFADSVLLEQGLFGDKETVASKVGSGKLLRFDLAMVG